MSRYISCHIFGKKKKKKENKKKGPQLNNWLSYDWCVGFWMIPNTKSAMTVRFTYSHTLPFSHPTSHTQFMVYTSVYCFTYIPIWTTVQQGTCTHLLKNYHHFTQAVATLWSLHITKRFTSLWEKFMSNYEKVDDKFRTPCSLPLWLLILSISFSWVSTGNVC
jgi:hypothetical protein